MATNCLLNIDLCAQRQTLLSAVIRESSGRNGGSKHRERLMVAVGAENKLQLHA